MGEKGGMEMEGEREGGRGVMRLGGMRRILCDEEGILRFDWMLNASSEGWRELEGIKRKGVPVAIVVE